MNCVPLSDIMSSGMPYTLNTWWNKALEVCMVVSSFFRDMRQHALENQLVTARMVVYPLELGRLVMKSTVRVRPW